MDWSVQDLGAIGEFVGSIGVIATLIYLAVQIRQNTASMDETRRLTLAQAYYQRASKNYEVWAAIGNGPLGTIIQKARRTGVESLSEEERDRFASYCFGNKNWFDNIHYQHNQGYFDDEYYDSTFRHGVAIWAPMWEEIGVPGKWRPDFELEISRIVADHQKA